MAGEEGPVLLLLEGGKAPGIGTVMRGIATPATGLLSLIVGPAGVFAPAEAAAALASGATPASLGPRVLRAETASVAALAVIMHELGELGG